MKYIMLLSIFSLFACKTMDKSIASEKEILAVFSKGACLGKCPVYDITIYTDGSYRYVGVKNVEVKGVLSDTLSNEELAIIKELLANSENTDHAFQKRRDKPIITLKHKSITTKFYAASAPSSLKAVNNWYDSFLEKMNRTSN